MIQMTISNNISSFWTKHSSSFDNCFDNQLNKSYILNMLLKFKFKYLQIKEKFYYLVMAQPYWFLKTVSFAFLTAYLLLLYIFKINFSSNWLNFALWWCLAKCLITKFSSFILISPIKKTSSSKTAFHYQILDSTFLFDSKKIHFDLFDSPITHLKYLLTDQSHDG